MLISLFLFLLKFERERVKGIKFKILLRSWRERKKNSKYIISSKIFHCYSSDYYFIRIFIVNFNFFFLFLLEFKRKKIRIRVEKEKFKVISPKVGIFIVEHLS